MNLLIIIRGPLGVGKTTISQLLAQKLSADYYSVDDILAKNNLDIVDENLGCIPEKNFLKVNQIITQKIIQNNQSVIIDGNFYYQNQIADLIKNIPFQSFVYTLTAPLEVCIKRDSERPNSHGIDATTAVFNLVSQFNYGEIIDISNLTIDDSVNQIYSKIINA